MSKLIFVAVLAALALVAEPLCPKACPSGWHFFSGSCYKHFPYFRTWNNAESYCKQQGGHLASVHSNEEYQLVRGLYLGVKQKEDGFWIGLSDLRKEGTWVWSDGSKVDFTYWLRGQPDNVNGNEDCAEGNANLPRACEGEWNDITCNSRRTFICARKTPVKCW